jgi:hypothetical protein
MSAKAWHVFRDRRSYTFSADIGTFKKKNTSPGYAMSCISLVLVVLVIRALITYRFSRIQFPDLLPRTTIYSVGNSSTVLISVWVIRFIVIYQWNSDICLVVNKLLQIFKLLSINNNIQHIIYEPAAEKTDLTTSPIKICDVTKWRHFN